MVPYLLQDKALTLLSAVDRTHAKLLRNCGSSPHLTALLPSYFLSVFLHPFSYFVSFSAFSPSFGFFHVALA